MMGKKRFCEITCGDDQISRNDYTGGIYNCAKVSRGWAPASEASCLFFGEKEALLPLPSVSSMTNELKKGREAGGILRNRLCHAHRERELKIVN